MNDPSLIGARRAIYRRYRVAVGRPAKVDYDGIILKVNQLANQIDNLRLADNNDDDFPRWTPTAKSSQLHWRMARESAKSWQALWTALLPFDAATKAAVPLLAPNQDIYLRENIPAPVCWLRHKRYRAIRKRHTKQSAG